MPPPHGLSRGNRFLSRSSVDTPRAASVIAAMAPAGPPPPTTTSAPGLTTPAPGATRARPAPRPAPARGRTPAPTPPRARRSGSHRREPRARGPPLGRRGVRRDLQRADTPAARRLGGDRLGARHADRRADGLGEDARRVPLGAPPPPPPRPRGAAGGPRVRGLRLAAPRPEQ